MDGVLFFEVFVLFVVFVRLRAGAGDLVDGHLADHGAEIGGAFEGLLFVEVVHLFDGAGVEGRAVVFFVEGLFHAATPSGWDSTVFRG